MSEYFVKQSYGKIWHFCHNRQGICFCTMTDQNLGMYEVLEGEGQGDFDVLIDDLDCLHVLCQNKNGDILYFYFDGSKWNKTVVLQSKIPSPTPKQFAMLRSNNWINLFYVITYKGKKMLTHQILDTDAQPPVALDYIKGDFSAAQDSMNNLHVLFESEIASAVGIRTYRWSQKEWQEFQPVAVPDGFEQGYLLLDDQDEPHMAGVVGEEVVYVGKDVVTLGPGKRPILLGRDQLAVMWYNPKRDSVMASSREAGGGFHAPTEFMAGRFVAAKCFGVRHTVYEQGFRGRDCYGYISDNAARLYLLNDFFTVAKKPPKPIPKSVESEARAFAQSISPDYQPGIEQPTELIKLKIQLEQVQRGIEQMQQQLSAMEILLRNNNV